MKFLRWFAIASAMCFCGCESQGTRQIPVTVLNPQHLQGDSLYADRQAALRVNDHLCQVPECYNYTVEILKDLKSPIFTNCPDGASFDLRIEIYPDGSIGNVAVYGWTNAVWTPLYIQAIKTSQFPKWPDRMHSIVGQDYLIMWINTGVYPEPQGPG